MTPPLFHFTCGHRYPLIVAAGRLVPNPMVTPSLVWLTDLATPIRDVLGLGNTWGLLHCDRTAHRIDVPEPPEHVIRWHLWRRAHPEHAAIAYVWENAEGARPAHWWVSEEPLAVEP